MLQGQQLGGMGQGVQGGLHSLPGSSCGRLLLCGFLHSLHMSWNRGVQHQQRVTAQLAQVLQGLQSGSMAQHACVFLLLHLVITLHDWVEDDHIKQERTCM